MAFKINSELKRYPHFKNETLQAWDSADELILQHLDEVELKTQKILIINDQFGALSFALQNYNITTFTDSYVSYKGIMINTNNMIEPIHHLKDLSDSYDLVLIQLPKNMSFFEDILCHLSQHLHPRSKVICGGMIKHMAKASFDLLQKYIGTTSTSLARKKARLIFANFQREKSQSPYPINLSIEGFEGDFTNHSNLFSREKLDIGTRFLLEHIPEGDYKTILDLGCANGIIGIKAKKINPKARIIFTDESSMAIESAKMNYEKMAEGEADFIWTHCYEGQPENSLDLVICNPPFHQQNIIGDFIAWQMFNAAFRSLKKGGIIRIIGNGHLGYQMKVKKIFGNSEIIATNNKFMIVDATKFSD